MQNMYVKIVSETGKPILIEYLGISGKNCRFAGNIRSGDRKDYPWAHKNKSKEVLIVIIRIEESVIQSIVCDRCKNQEILNF